MDPLLSVLTENSWLLTINDDGNFMSFHYEQIDPDDSETGDEKLVLAFVIDTMRREIRYQYYARTAQTLNGREVAVVHPIGQTGA